MDSFNSYFKDQPIDLSTAPSSSTQPSSTLNYNKINNNFHNYNPSSSSSSSFFNTNTNNNSNNNTTNISSNWNNSNNLINNNNLQLHELEKLKNLLKIKELETNQLESEIIKLKSLNSKSSSSSIINSDESTIIPSNYLIIFNKLGDKIHELNKELLDTKTRLNSIITSILSNPNYINSSSSIKNGRFDEFEIFEKILIKLQNLQDENKELLKIVSFGKLKQLQIDLNFKNKLIEELNRENEILKSKIINKDE
ncbi:hypothetical protein WICMUC_005442 [Wickerhamomyces mucosus]|uniref:Uncharacterized protein n=1 Tax=Wickerhamomyces mucosus TaxID=1378264 RepID=A0A9P8P8D9_9ASCO|nr:hypothetical protein WICMUC_005442 [Wickerhamomyces mucosus]